MAGWLTPAALLLVALPPAGLPPVYDLACVLVVFPLLVVLAANATVGGATARANTILGRLSYGLYVLHAPILVAARFLEPKAVETPLRLVWYGAAVALAIVAAILGERWIDRPARRWAAKFERSVGKPTPATGTVQVRSA